MLCVEKQLYAKQVINVSVTVADQTAYRPIILKVNMIVARENARLEVHIDNRANHDVAAAVGQSDGYQLMKLAFEVDRAFRHARWLYEL